MKSKFHDLLTYLYFEGKSTGFPKTPSVVGLNCNCPSLTACSIEKKNQNNFNRGNIRSGTGWDFLRENSQKGPVVFSIYFWHEPVLFFKGKL